MPLSTGELLPGPGHTPPMGLQRPLELTDRPGPLLKLLGSTLGFEY